MQEVKCLAGVKVCRQVVKCLQTSVNVVRVRKCGCECYVGKQFIHADGQDQKVAAAQQKSHRQNLKHHMHKQQQQLHTGLSTNT